MDFDSFTKEMELLISVVMKACNCCRNTAIGSIDKVESNIEAGDASYASAALELGLSVNFGSAGFDGADLIASAICI